MGILTFNNSFCKASALSGAVKALNDRTLDTAFSHGSDEETLMVRGKASATYSRKSWIRFDLSGQFYFTNAPARFDVTYVDSPSYAGRVNIYVLEAGFTPASSNILGTSWSESDIDWFNAPGNYTNSPYALLSADTDVKYTQWHTNNVTITNGDIISVTLTNLAEYLQSDETVTFIMSSYDYAIGTRGYFASSENTNFSGPTLTPTRPVGTVVLIK